MPMSNARLEALIWTLIYAGLLLACLGIFVWRGATALGVAFVAVGAVTSAIGAVLIWVRSKRPKD
jgi:hypothetical protein